MLKRFNKSENEQQRQVLVMSETSVNLSRSHRYKEKFLEILDCNDRETAKEKMQEWIYNASNCGIPQFEKCAHSMQNWLTGILTVLPKAVIIKLKFLKETHTVTKISEDSETAFYIYFLIYNKTKNRQLPISKLLALNFSF